MSVRDLPDYTRQVVIRYEGGFIGLEELAARLGSIVPYDLRGNIVLMEDFESELTEWTDSSEGDGSSATRQTRHKYSGDWSLKLHKISGVSRSAACHRHLHFPGITKYAAFCRFAWDDDCYDIGLSLLFRTETGTMRAQVNYDRSITTLNVRTTGNTKYEVDDALELGESTFIFFPMLVTFNLATGYYDKLYFADREYDISSVALYPTAIGGREQLTVMVEALADSAPALDTYFDDIIIAKNVP